FEESVVEFHDELIYVRKMLIVFVNREMSFHEPAKRAKNRSQQKFPNHCMIAKSLKYLARDQQGPMPHLPIVAAAKNAILWPTIDGDCFLRSPAKLSNRRKPARVAVAASCR